MLLITDSFPSPNGAGISQTLYNLLDHWPGQITVLVSEAAILPAQQERLPAEVVVAAAGPFKPIKNRLGRYANPWLQKKRLAWQQSQPIPDQWPKPSEAWVLVSTTVPEKLHLAWCLLQQGYTVVPYFMDDWLAGNTLAWKGGNIQQVAKDLLTAAPAWLMISEALKTTFIHRYQLKPTPCLVVHNPSPVNEFANSSLQFAGQDENDLSCKLPTANSKLSKEELPTANCQLVYAGSIWPMHADALIALAKAIHLLHSHGKTEFQLLLYAPPAHWKQYKHALHGPGVQYMGWKPYHEMHQYLQQGWLLVCTASFNAAHQAYSHSSVQTKLTDYMAAGKPILFVGPDDAASGDFVNTHDIGFTLATHLPADIAERLQAIARMPGQYLRKQENGLQLANTTFSKPAVQKALYHFLEQQVAKAKK